MNPERARNASFTESARPRLASSELPPPKLPPPKLPRLTRLAPRGLLA